ncbi:DUF4013 domain-containing protein [Methanobrevibacter sp.]|uniref:DUF4013 domain-containing protein n=1 Tax=Methanobrevibacter sp. TaxID=66852 RepID=UPI0025D9A17F|nr:DUF4013 domain-containing protein [Methanobrevibacter sp.]MBQ6099965.1 DUF4013 domain-containing protein [Methanobrevibacter sp.]MBQ6512691.1 DUF4013 domain-containing protein [Methanobrevibacter sp.]
MILDIYKDALEYSAKDWKTLVLLGVICLFSFLLLPAFLLTGYNYRVINTAVHGVINGRDPLPGFDDVIDMFVDGVKVVIVQIAYLLVPAIVFIIFAACAGQLHGMASSVLMIVGCLITFVLFVVACLMQQMGLCHMAYHDGAFSKAFAISEIREVIDEIGWFNCIATYLGLIIITLVIAAVVTAIIYAIFTIFGISGAILGANPGGIFILGAIINSLVTMFIVGPYLSIFNARSIGLLYTMQI